MDYGLMHSIATVAAFLAFMGVVWWAYRPGNRARFEDIGRAALDNDPILNRRDGNAREKSE